MYIYMRIQTSRERKELKTKPQDWNNSRDTGDEPTKHRQQERKRVKEPQTMIKNNRDQRNVYLKKRGDEPTKNSQQERRKKYMPKHRAL
jgi:hypothetical protein